MAIPILLSLTEGYSEAERHRVARISTLTVATVLAVVPVAGETLLHRPGNSLGSFRVAGGIVLFLMALAMLQAQADPVRSTPSEAASAANRASIAVEVVSNGLKELFPGSWIMKEGFFSRPPQCYSPMPYTKHLCPRKLPIVPFLSPPIHKILF